MAGFLVFVFLIAPWLTHIFYCFGSASWGFLIAGAIMPPIGVIHGFYLWFR